MQMRFNGGTAKHGQMTLVDKYVSVCHDLNPRMVQVQPVGFVRGRSGRECVYHPSAWDASDEFIFLTTLVYKQLFFAWNFNRTCAPRDKRMQKERKQGTNSALDRW